MHSRISIDRVRAHIVRKKKKEKKRKRKSHARYIIYQRSGKSARTDRLQVGYGSAVTPVFFFFFIFLRGGSRVAIWFLRTLQTFSWLGVGKSECQTRTLPPVPSVSYSFFSVPFWALARARDFRKSTRVFLFSCFGSLFTRLFTARLF